MVLLFFKIFHDRLLFFRIHQETSQLILVAFGHKKDKIGVQYCMKHLCLDQQVMVGFFAHLQKRFHEIEVKGRDMQQVEIDAVVDGSYSQVVHFLNGLQRAQNVYAVEELEAKADAAQGANGRVRVQMHITTYFRTT